MGVSPQLAAPKLHVSYSALMDLLTCPKRFQLHRVVGIEGDPWIAASGGRAVHLATEAYDRFLLTKGGR